MTEPENETNRFPFWSYEDLALLIAAIVPCGLISAGLVRLSGVNNIGGKTLILQTGFFALLLTVLYLLVSRRYRQPFWRSMGWFWPIPGALWWVAAGPVLAVSLAVLGALMRTPEVPDPIKDLITNRISLAVIMLFAVVFGPIYEELFFRGFLYPLLVKSFGAAAGIILSAIPFALLHGPQYEWAWQQTALVGLAGAAFGVVRYRTGSTAASTILHSCFNLTQFIAFLIFRG